MREHAVGNNFQLITMTNSGALAHEARLRSTMGK